MQPINIKGAEEQRSSWLIANKPTEGELIRLKVRTWSISRRRVLLTVWISN